MVSVATIHRKNHPVTNLVFHPGSIHFAQTFCDDESADKKEKDAVHWIASCTKFVTTVAVMQCVERGQLRLDDDISTVLPEWKDPKVLIGFDDKDQAQFRPARRSITLRCVSGHPRA